MCNPSIVYKTNRAHGWLAREGRQLNKEEVNLSCRGKQRNRHKLTVIAMAHTMS